MTECTLSIKAYKSNINMSNLILLMYFTLLDNMYILLQ